MVVVVVVVSTCITVSLTVRPPEDIVRESCKLLCSRSQDAPPTIKMTAWSSVQMIDAALAFCGDPIRRQWTDGTMCLMPCPPGCCGVDGWSVWRLRDVLHRLWLDYTRNKLLAMSTQTALIVSDDLSFSTTVASPGGPAGNDAYRHDEVPPGGRLP